MRRHSRGDHVSHLRVWAPSGATIRSEGNPDALGVESHQVAGLNPERLLSLRPVSRAGLELFQFLGWDGPAQPAQIRFDPSVGQVWNEDDVWALLEHRDDLVVNVHVPYAVRERVDTRAEKPLRIFEREDVGGDAEPMLMGLIDDRAIELRRQFDIRSVPIVHPDLDEVDVQLGELLHGLSGFLFGVDPVGGSVRPGSGRVSPRPAVR